jgi:Dehydrogenases with different specificities (related to short-chain alcohol dehydrogenases)
MSDIKNKVIIITGGLGLLGLSLVEKLAKDDAKVVVLDLKSSKLLNKIKNYNFIKKNLFYFRCDVSEKKHLLKIKKKIISKFKKIDVLINAAALNDAVEKNPDPKSSMFENYSLSDWNKSFKVNLTSIFLSSQIFGVKMAKQKHGSIINIASTYGIVAPDQSIYINNKLKQTFYKNPSYPSTKGAVISFTKYLASYWGGLGVRVNCISPGGIENKQNKNFIKKYSSKTLLKRMAKPHEIYGAVKLLCSNESSYITGSNIVVDGGWTAI